LQEEDARDANKDRYSKHDPALPLYTSADAARALSQLQPVGYERPIAIAPGIELDFINAGHLLGSAYARIKAGGKTILFGGDLGRYGRPVLPDPSPVSEADVLLIESTYGDRLHEADDDGAKLAEIINSTSTRGGKVIIPSFAIGRVEEVLYWLKRLEEQKRIPVLPVYIDSPMAVSALGFYSSRLSELDEQEGSGVRPGVGPGVGPGVRYGVRHLTYFATSRLVTVASPQQSADLIASRKPAIVISASGMATGGRVLRHLAAALPDARNSVLFVGFQAPGTRGRTLVEGATEVKMLGRVIPVAARIARIDAMSAHADYNEMLRWLSGFSRPPSMTFLVHGEPVALDALAARIATEKQWPVHIARYRERVELP
jgi:metallo-beta-lactamase family protein